MITILDALNDILAVVVFSSFLGSPFSQRARVLLAYLVVPMLCLYAGFKVAKADFNLVEELTFYASFHSNPGNQLIHVIFVPLLIATSFVWMAYVPSPFGASILAKGPMNFWQFMAASAWSAHWINASPDVGSCVAALTFAQAAAASALVARESKGGAKGVPASKFGTAAKWAGLLHLLSWYMQIHPGHKVLEGRKPALLDSLLQAFMDAPLFVWFEVAFKFGYNPQMQQQLAAAVQKQHLLWQAAG